MTAVLVAALIICGLVLIIYHIHHRKTMNALNKMLDEAISGDFEATQYDETQLSK